MKELKKNLSVYPKKTFDEIYGAAKSYIRKIKDLTEDNIYIKSISELN